MTKLALKSENQKPVLSIAHMASNKPFYCIEEVDIDARKVTVAYFNENNPDSDIENKTIALQDLVDFTNEFYRDYDNVSGERLTMLGYDYLKENLNSVTTDYLNAKF